MADSAVPVRIVNESIKFVTDKDSWEKSGVIIAGLVLAGGLLTWIGKITSSWFARKKAKEEAEKDRVAKFKAMGNAIYSKAYLLINKVEEVVREPGTPTDVFQSLHKQFLTLLEKDDVRHIADAIQYQFLENLVQKISDTDKAIAKSHNSYRAGLSHFNPKQPQALVEPFTEYERNHAIKDALQILLIDVLAVGCGFYLEPIQRRSNELIIWLGLNELTDVGPVTDEELDGFATELMGEDFGDDDAILRPPKPSKNMRYDNEESRGF